MVHSSFDDMIISGKASFILSELLCDCCLTPGDQLLTTSGGGTITFSMCLSTITTNNNTPTLLCLCVLGSDHLPLFGEGCVIYIYFLPQHVLEEEKHLLA